MSTKAIILAAGLGKRLGELTKSVPKCLIEIKGKTLLQRQIDSLKKAGIEDKDIYIVIGAKGDCWTQGNIERIKQICPNVITNFDNINTRNAYSLYLGLKEIQEPCEFLAIDSDLFLNETILKEILDSSYKNLIISKKAENIDAPGNRVLIDKEKKVVYVGKTLKIDESNFPWDIFGGIIKINKENFNDFSEECGKQIYYSEDISHPLNLYCQTNAIFNLNPKTKWVSINTFDDIRIVEEITSYEYTPLTKNILITGASGFLGKKLFDKLSREFNTYGTYCSEKKFGEFLYLDITDKEAVQKLVKRLNPQIIIHTAALSNADFCEKNKEEAYKVNVKGTINIIDACKESNIQLIFLSTDYVYDGDNSPYGEDSTKSPVNYYGETKLECENIIKNELKDYIILRPTIFYGFNDEEDKETFVTSVLKKLRTGKEISADNYVKKYPLLIDDLAEAIKILLKKDALGEFNLGIEKGVTRYEWALQIAEVFGLDKSLIKPEKTENIAKKPNNVLYDLSKIKKYSLSFKDLKTGLTIMKNQEACMFRMIYSLRPDKLLLGQPVSLFRLNIGKELAKECPVDADLIIGIPESGIYGALGYAEESKIPFRFGLMKDEYSRRTLLYERPKLRSERIREKLIAVSEIIKGKSIVIVDEAIASGKTLSVAIDLLKQSGAKEIHVRINSPVMLFNCKNNILDKDAELLATKFFAKGNFNKENIEDELKIFFGVNSLKFISFDNFLKQFNYNHNIKPCVDCLMTYNKDLSKNNNII